MAWCQFSDQLLHFSGSSAACLASLALVCLQAVVHLFFLHWRLCTACFGVAQAGSPTVIASGSKVAHLGQIVNYVAMPIHSLCIYWTKKWRVHWPHAKRGLWTMGSLWPRLWGTHLHSKSNLHGSQEGRWICQVGMAIIDIAICQWSVHACRHPRVSAWVTCISYIVTKRSAHVPWQEACSVLLCYFIKQCILMSYDARVWE